MISFYVEVIFSFERNNTFPEFLQGISAILRDESVVKYVGGAITRLIWSCAFKWQYVDKVYVTI